MLTADVTVILKRIDDGEYVFRVAYPQDPGKSTYFVAATDDRYGWVISTNPQRLLIDELDGPIDVMVNGYARDAARAGVPIVVFKKVAEESETA